MQRIDENTYIDETLVTCAEYQLFIDEMREQGKYYQPDNWTSYQFPDGQALEPILGMRQSDAVAFCEWLTRREDGQWLYKLPSQEIAAEHPLQLPNPFPFGFWLTGEDVDRQFAWISSIPGDLFAMNLDHALIYSRAFANNTDLILYKLVKFSKDNYDDIHSSIDDIAVDLNNTLHRALNRSCSLNTPLFYTPPYDQVTRITELGVACNYAEKLISHPTIVRTINRANSTSIAETINEKLNAFVQDTVVQVRGISQKINLLNWSILTLCERIAGRSPAFEGIRLVKERIR